MPIIQHFPPMLINYSSEDDVLFFSHTFSLELTFPSSYGGFIVVNSDLVDIDPLLSMTTETASTFLDSTLIAPSTTTSLLISNTTKLLLVYYTWNIQDGWGLAASSANIVTLTYVPPDLNCSITPNPEVTYTEPTDFVLNFDKGYSGIIVINDCNVIPDIPPPNFFAVQANNIPRIHHGGSITIHALKSTKLTIYYYETSISEYENVQQQVDTVYFNIEEKLNITVENYGKVVSFTDTAIVELVTTRPCDLEIKLTSFKTGVVNVLSATVDSSLRYSLEIDESYLIEFKAIDGSYETRQKYIFKKEQNDNRSVYTYYEQNGELTSNILETNTFDVEYVGE